MARLKGVVKRLLPDFALDAYKKHKRELDYKRNQELLPQEYPRELIRWYQRAHGGLLELGNPQTFTEKIQWMKLNDSTPEKGRLADKYLVRDYVIECIGEEYLVPLLGVWDDPREIDFNALPNRFALKATHGSAWNVVVKDKASLDVDKTVQSLRIWLDTDFSMQGGLQLHYRYCEPRVIAEAYIEELDGGLYDYKIHCFGGKPTFIQCIGDRNLEKHTGFQANFDTGWNNLGWTFETYPRFPHKVGAPMSLDEMLDIAAKLSRGFEYVRVDLYEVSGRPLFGEMTFTPANGVYPYRGSWTAERDLELGKLIDLGSITSKKADAEI